MTKVDPPRPMKKRMAASCVAFLTRPVNAVGIDAAIKINPMGIRAPNLSHIGPFTNRMKIVPATLHMEDVQICCFVNFRVILTSERRGAMANQMKKARKKLNHEQ